MDALFELSASHVLVGGGFGLGHPRVVDADGGVEDDTCEAVVDVDGPFGLKEKRHCSAVWR